VFGDTEAGILAAAEQGATRLWANTILFADHPLQTSSKIDHVAKDLKIIGQPPKLVEHFDDKYLVDNMLRAKGETAQPESPHYHISSSSSDSRTLRRLYWNDNIT
jgi:hypothetical protein